MDSGNVLSVIPGGLTALTFRFNYQRYFESSDTPNDFLLSTIQLLVPEYGEGVIIIVAAKYGECHTTWNYRGFFFPYIFPLSDEITQGILRTKLGEIQLP